ncbi:MAG: heavy-metal-associated domain-containing protein [Pseudonocardia sp.]
METTHAFRVTGMHCTSCGILIDEALEELDGVIASNTSVKAGRTNVTLDPTRCHPALVEDTIRDAGYHATAAADEAQSPRRGLAGLLRRHATP